MVNIDAYNDINRYLANLVESPVRTIDDVVAYNQANDGTEGAAPGIMPAFPHGQPNFLELIERKGCRNGTYYAALEHIRRQTREKGLDAALCYASPSGEAISLDALLFCDRRGIGQQYAVQAGYVVISIPVGLDQEGMPVSLSLQQTAWGDAVLVKWASARDRGSLEP